MSFLPALFMGAWMAGTAIEHARFRKIGLCLIIMADHAAVCIVYGNFTVPPEIGKVALRHFTVAFQAKIILARENFQVAAKLNFYFFPPAVIRVATQAIGELLGLCAVSR